MEILIFVVGGVVGYLIHSFLPAYFGEKGKNLATKEDIAEITRKVEEVRSEYAVILERLRALTQLRLAALDRRLQAHQEAFSLWRKLVAAVHRAEITDTVIECQTWWNQNCLYLSADSRQAFSDAYFAASAHKSMLQDRDAKLAISNWEKIVAAGDILVRAVELPPIADRESKSVD